MRSLADVFRVLEEMRQVHVVQDYAIDGAMAVLFYAEPARTYDLDVFVILKAGGATLAPCVVSMRKRFDGNPFKGCSPATICVHIGFSPDGPLLGRDDPLRLTERQLRPSQVATRNREATQAIARSLFLEGAVGFSWRSTLEASWSNATLFHERVRAAAYLAKPPEPLRLDMPAVVQAAEELGIRIS